MIFNLRTQKARARAQVAVNRQQALLERQFSKRLRAVLTRQVRAAADAVRAGRDFGPAVDAHAHDLVSAFRGEYSRVGQVFYEMVSDSFRKAHGKSGQPAQERKGMLGEFWRAFSGYSRVQAARKVTMVNDTTKRLIAGLIEMGTAEGDAYGAIADAIWESFGEAFSLKRSMRIARTEVHAASTFATQAAVDSTRVRFDREWIAMADERTRSSHRAAHGQVRGMNQPFDVGGEKLMFPGDPKGSAGNVINCRCVLIYHSAGISGSRTAARRREQEQYAGMEEVWM